MIRENKQANKVAIVTGSARRIGASIVKLLHEKEYNVVIHCLHSVEAAQALAKKLNGIRLDSALVIPADLKSPVASKIIDAALSWKGGLDLLINNASLFIRSKIDEAVSSNWNDLFSVNVQAPYTLSLAAYPLLAKNNGVIINITDIHGEKPLKDYAVYSQTKAALLMQTKALAREFAPKVRVNAVAPGAIEWPEKENALSDNIQQQIIAKTPLRTHGDPSYIAKAVLALVENPFITGQVLNVDGGRSIL